jgi:hypothetical protein
MLFVSVTLFFHFNATLNKTLKIVFMTRKRKASMSLHRDYEEQEQEQEEDEDETETEEDEEEDDTRETVYLTSDNEEYTADQIDAIPSIQSSVVLAPEEPDVEEVEVDEDDHNRPSTVEIDIDQLISPAQYLDALLSSITSSPTGNINAFSVLTPFFAQVGTVFDPEIRETQPRRRQLMDDLRSDNPFRNMRSASSTLGSTLGSIANNLNPFATIITSANMIPRVRPRRRHFHEQASSVIFTRNLRFNSDEYEMGEYYLNSLLEELYNNHVAVHFNVNLLNLLLEDWHANDREQFVDWHDFLLLLSAEVSRYGNFQFDESSMYEMLEHYVSSYGHLPHYTELDHVYEYMILHHDYPDFDDLRDMSMREFLFHADPEQFHQQDKIQIGAANVDTIPRVKNTETGLVCAVCQDEIQVDQTILRLPVCQHAFHAIAADCLGGVDSHHESSTRESEPSIASAQEAEGSILGWLATHNSCPLCKSQVSGRL